MRKKGILFQKLILNDCLRLKERRMVTAIKEKTMDTHMTSTASCITTHMLGVKMVNHQQ